MSITTITSQDFNQDPEKAKRAAKKGSVFISENGSPAHVLLSFEDYQALLRQRAGIADLLAMPEAANIEFDPPRLKGKLFRTADLS